jgi:protocadherin Fat 1/2/3
MKQIPNCFQEDECTEERCEAGSGKCKDVVVMEDGGGTFVSTDINSFVSPRHRHQTICVCKEGFAGDRCETVLNECAREPCPTFMSCTPDSSIEGYSCHCPEDLTGPLCNVNVTTCINRKCAEINPMSFSGKSYAQYTVKRSLERHLSASMAIKTLHPTGTIMFAAGDVDYSVLELVNGHIRLVF